MNVDFLYKIIARVYDLLDIIYFHDYEKSPRKAVLHSIATYDAVLDLCTGSGAIAVSLAK